VALFEAYRKLDKFDEGRPLKPWLFRIAHNRCIDFLRERGVRVEAETAAMVPEAVVPAEAPVLDLGRAVEYLVANLPPMERVCPAERCSRLLTGGNRGAGGFLGRWRQGRPYIVAEQGWPPLLPYHNPHEAWTQN
jgi:RNA polymerase sigma-70 factor (ECF subfamily)